MILDLALQASVQQKPYSKCLYATTFGLYIDKDHQTFIHKLNSTIPPWVKTNSDHTQFKRIHDFLILVSDPKRADVSLFNLSTPKNMFGST